MGVSENEGYLILGSFKWILLFRVLSKGPLFSETPIYVIKAKPLRKPPEPLESSYYQRYRWGSFREGGALIEP